MLGQARGSLSDGLTAPPSGGEMTAALLSHIDKAVVCVTLLLLGHTPLPSLSPLFCLTAPRSLLTPTTVHNEWTFSCEINSRSSKFMWTMVTESVCKSCFSISSLLSSESQIISLWRHISLLEKQSSATIGHPGLVFKISETGECGPGDQVAKTIIMSKQLIDFNWLSGANVSALPSDRLASRLDQSATSCSHNSAGVGKIAAF